MSELAFRNRQRVRRVNLRLLRQITGSLLEGLGRAGNYELCIHLVGDEEMARINWQYLQHEGSTDVITFDHSDLIQRPTAAVFPLSSAKRRRESGRGGAPVDTTLRGEIFICINDAVAQSREFHTTWQSELVRYIVHGVLHLLGYDDLTAAGRRKMKTEEERLLRELTARFPLSKLAHASKLAS